MAGLTGRQPFTELSTPPISHIHRGSLSIDCGINAVIIEILFSSGFMPSGMVFNPREGVKSHK